MASILLNRLYVYAKESVISHKPHSNLRMLISRNKREGSYMGHFAVVYDKAKHHRVGGRLKWPPN